MATVRDPPFKNERAVWHHANGFGKEEAPETPTQTAVAKKDDKHVDEIHDAMNGTGNRQHIIVAGPMIIAKQYADNQQRPTKRLEESGGFKEEPGFAVGENAIKLAVPSFDRVHAFSIRFVGLMRNVYAYKTHVECLLQDGFVDVARK